MPSSVMWAEQLRIFPHTDRGVSVSYTCFHPNLLGPWLSWALLAELLDQFQYYLPAKPLLFSSFSLSKKKKKGGNTKNFKVDLNIQIHTSWRRLRRRQKKKLPCLLHIYHQNSGADLRRIMWKKEELVWLKQGRNLKWEEKKCSAILWTELLRRFFFHIYSKLKILCRY